MADDTQVTDPFQPWREWLGQAERELNQSLSLMMPGPAFNEQAGKLMAVFAAQQARIGEAQQDYLRLANIPTRDDLLRLAERLGKIDDRLRRIESLLEDTAGPLAAESAIPSPRASRPRVKRTRKPPPPPGPSSGSGD